MDPSRLPLFLLLWLALVLAGCGSGSSDSGSGQTQPGVATTVGGPAAAARGGDGAGRVGSGDGESRGTASGGDRAAADRGGGPAFTPPIHEDPGDGAARFETEGGDNSIQESGSEASVSEFEEAAVALHAYLDARAAGAWGVACEYLAPGVGTQLGQVASTGRKPSCAELLAALAARIPGSALREAAVADVGSFRVDADSGFLLYRGARGVDYFVPMIRVDGIWKVAALAPSALP